MRTAVVVGVIAALIGAVLIAGAGDEASPNPYVVIGLVNGAAYGLIALGLVLVYKGARVFNFAQGEFGTLAAFIVYVLIEQVQGTEIPYGIAVLVAVVGVTIVGLLMERIVVRPLLNAPRITVLVATIAFTLLAVGVQVLLFLPEAKNLPGAISAVDAEGTPRGPEIFDYIIEPQQLLIVGVLGALAVILGYFFSKTDLGLAVLATSQDAFATRVVGIGVERMSRFIWGSAAFLGAVAGVLFIPVNLALAPGVMTSNALIPSFTGAVIGGITSLPGAFVGGITVGVIQQLAGWASQNYHFGETALQELIPGFPSVALVVVLLLVLLARPQGLLGTEA
ncbi:MAG TPA: branched-chain amino acid ABC transporter permease [Actinomycetota bacterium]|nr:branched-chain amino acid ABC transporter permease [Actinomycetota bacterium]